MGDTELLSLNWDNHGATFCDALASLLWRGKDKYTDVTVSCEGRFYQVHKFVLSTCSEYFEKVFENTPCKHPVIVLSDVKCDVLESLLTFMYKGVVSVAHRDLSRLIKVAELLQVKGLKLPNEPAAFSELGSSKLSNEGLLSSRSSSDSPSPKRRRRGESNNYLTSSSQSRNNDSHESLRSEDRDNRVKEDRLFDLPQKPLCSAVTVSVVETSVKGDILDNDHVTDILESEYGGLGDHSGDVSRGTCGLSTPRLDDAKDGVSEPSPVTHPHPDPVLEVLASPSGIRGVFDGGVITRSSRGKVFASGDSQDMGVSRKRRPVASAKKYSCSYCDFRTHKKYNLKRHIRRHTGEEPSYN
ncbi:protein abrupt-like isoform X2 [Palaemon carinicauda]|uniref:protein abrupt-like isoform X2 n=1 Tax=Palaemon carinicauda TaxID=392227 RepID=UPI0035B5E168